LINSIKRVYVLIKGETIWLSLSNRRKYVLKKDFINAHCHRLTLAVIGQKATGSAMWTLMVFGAIKF